MAEIMGRYGHMGSEVMNCSAPDTGNIGECIVPFAAVCQADISTSIQKFLRAMATLSSNRGG